MQEAEHIDNRYKVIKEINKGGMGKLLLCEDVIIKREVAVKLLLTDGSDDAALRFQNEAKAAGRLEHENIIEVHDFGQDENGKFFLVLEYLNGESLDALLEKRGGVLGLEEAIPILLQICDGLKHAHEKGGPS